MDLVRTGRGVATEQLEQNRQCVRQRGCRSARTQKTRSLRPLVHHASAPREERSHSQSLSRPPATSQLTPASKSWEAQSQDLSSSQQPPTSTIAQVPTTFYSLPESHLASSKPASALDAALRDGIPAPQPSQGSLDSPQPGKATFGHENGSIERQQAPRRAT